jgi:hypothetical protein
MRTYSSVTGEHLGYSQCSAAQRQHQALTKCVQHFTLEIFTHFQASEN